MQSILIDMGVQGREQCQHGWLGRLFFFFWGGFCAFWNEEWHKELTEESEGHVQHSFPLAEVGMLVQKWPQMRCLCGGARWLGSCGESVWGGKGPGQVCGLRRLAWLGVRTVYYRMIDGEKVESGTDFIFLGLKIIAEIDCSHEIKRCLLIGSKAMTNLDNVLKSRDITLLTKVHK